LNVTDESAFARLPASEIFERIEAGALVLVPTNRLARDLSRRLEARRRAVGVAVCEAPAIELFDNWLARLWNDLDDPRLLLTAGAERARWETTLEGLKVGEQVDDVAALARSAASAWQTVAAWGEPPLEANATQEVRAFARWRAAFRKELVANVELTRAELAGALTVVLGGDPSALDLPREIVLLAFELLEPDRRGLLAACEAAGVRIAVCDGTREEEGRIEVREALDAADEIRRAAREIAATLREQPDSRIAVVVGSLDADRLLLERILAEELDPRASLVGGAARPSVVDIAGGIPLAAQASVRHGLDLLSLAAEGNAFETVSRLLLSPYPKPGTADEAASEQSGGELAVEQEARARVEAALRGDHLRRVALGDLCERAGSKKAKGFAAMLRKAIERRAADPATATLSEWCDIFASDLWHLGAFDVGEDDRERLAVKKLRDAIDQTAALTPFLGKGAVLLDRAAALARLSSVVAELRTQPPVEGAPVAVLELLDAAGLAWDRLWVLGLTDDVVPAPARPSPLLPAGWQREQGVRRGSPEAELVFARERMRRLWASAPEVRASWRRTGSGGEELGPSPLLPAGAAADGAAPRAWYLRELPEALEARVPDGRALPLRKTLGATALQHVAACSFRGVARLRWLAEPLEAPEAEPCARTRGILMHAVMEAIFREYGDAAALASATHAALAAIAEEAARKALAGRATHAVPAWLHGPVVAWARDLAVAWVNYERNEREGGWTVAEIEKALPGTLGEDLSISGRADRIDRLADGSLLLIDFKTATDGKGPGEWKTRRPRDPQLPVYAHLKTGQGERIGGLAFANLSARNKCTLQGLASTTIADKLAPPGDLKSRNWPPDYDDALATMLANVEAVADLWRGGGMDVDAANTSVCRNCGLESLCRVYESAIEDEDGDDAGEEA
jgi:ATP-dependent helicase/nuclease subunit B